MDLYLLILFQVLLIIINNVLKERNRLRVIYVGNIVCIMLLRYVMDYLWKKLLRTYLIMNMLSNL